MHWQGQLHIRQTETYVYGLLRCTEKVILPACRRAGPPAGVQARLPPVEVFMAGRPACRRAGPPAGWQVVWS
ncbi:MAG: hypothetical protein EA392_07555 [Cryomorphaceae bacterium]|nr:MAG: hypothetical protein EA392_07555 [Cryomorphaceae bacterium]